MKVEFEVLGAQVYFYHGQEVGALLMSRRQASRYMLEMGSKGFKFVERRSKLKLLAAMSARDRAKHIKREVVKHDAG